MHAKSTVKPIKDGMKGVILPSSGDDQGARKENPVRKIPDFLSSLLLSSQVSKSISVFGVIPIIDFERYEKSVQGRVALAKSVLAGDMVPGGEFRAAKQELSGLKAEQEQTRQKFEETQPELLKTRREVGFLRRIVSWIREHFPSIFDHIPMDDLAKKNDANQPVINGGPGGIVPPGL